MLYTRAASCSWRLGYRFSPLGIAHHTQNEETWKHSGIGRPVSAESACSTQLHCISLHFLLLKCRVLCGKILPRANKDLITLFEERGEAKNTSCKVSVCTVLFHTSVGSLVREELGCYWFFLLQPSWATPSWPSINTLDSSIVCKRGKKWCLPQREPSNLPG